MSNDHNAALNTRFLASITGRRGLSLSVQNTDLGGAANASSPFSARGALIPMGGDSIDFEPLTIQFFLKDTMEEWFEIYKWMVETVADPSNHETVSVEILDAQKNPVMRLNYKLAIPIDLGGFTLTSIDEEDYLTATAIFEYATIQVENLLTGETVEYGE